MRKKEPTTAFRQENCLAIVLPSGDVARVVIVTHLQGCSAGPLPDLVPASWTGGDGLQLVYRLQFLVPARSNRGRRFPIAFYVELEDHVTSVVAALSWREGAVTGSWTAATRVYHDRSREYFVDVPIPTLAQELAIGLYQFIALRFEQLAVSIDITPRFSTVFTPKEDIMSLPSRFSWQPQTASRSRSLSGLAARFAHDHPVTAPALIVGRDHCGYAANGAPRVTSIKKGRLS